MSPSDMIDPFPNSFSMAARAVFSSLLSFPSCLSLLFSAMIRLPNVVNSVGHSYRGGVYPRGG